MLVLKCAACKRKLWRYDKIVYTAGQIPRFLMNISINTRTGGCGWFILTQEPHRKK